MEMRLRQDQNARLHRVNLILVACVFTALQAAFAQTQPDAPKFDAASVKPVEWHGGSVVMDSDAGRIEYRQFGLKALVWVAFQGTLPQIVWPDWMANYKGDVYDISATFPTGTTQDQQHLMLQALLADRFKMVVHHETRQQKVYALVVSSRGLKIRKSDNPPDDATLTISVRTGKDGFHLNDRLPNAPASAPYGIKISKLVKYLNNGFLDRVMVDKTGLEGYYDINLFIPPEIDTHTEPDGTTASSPNMQSYFDALDAQLGLKVETQTAPVEMLVIDHLEQNPTGN
jgi:uncharacterized protein (TIGR03435 family)